MKKLLVALTFNLVFIASKLVAQTWVTIPDANFATYLQSIIPGAMSGNQMNTSSSLVTTTTQTISIGNIGITNLDGIQYFTSLTDLVCSQNYSLTTLPSLPNSLKYLDCPDNGLTSLPTLPNSLVSLECNENYITSLPSLPNTLTYIDCENNALTNLPTLPNSLTYLECELNHLTTLPNIPNTLTWLDCAVNDITCFPTFPNSIGTLQIGGNPYNCLPNHIAAMDSADLAKPLCAVGNTNGCPVAVAGIEQVNGINAQIFVYPNPAKDVINVNGLPINEETHIQLIDMFGNFVREYSTSDKTKNIDVSGLNEGVYNLSITTKEGVINKRVVIEK